MKYSFCHVEHNPPETYGDCIRACIASILNLETLEVPHFYHDNCEADEGTNRIREFLGARGLGLVHCPFPGDNVTLPQLLEFWKDANPDIPAMLIAGTGKGDHAVIVLNGVIEHNPAWSGSKIIEPHSNGFWNMLVIAVK